MSAALRVSTAAAVLACGGTATDSNSVTNVGTGGGTPTLTSITVTLPSPSLTVGQTETASASGLDQNSAAIATGTVTWTSSTPAVATVSQTGLVTAVSAGTTQIVATAGGKTGQATLAVTVVTPSPVASVTVAPTTFTLVIGTTQQMTATTVDAKGNVLTGRSVTWSSSDPTVATVSPNGLVQAIAVGTASIVATSETKSGTATVTVAASAPTPSCTTASALRMTVGQVTTLTPSQVASFCVGGLSTTSEYVMIPFNNSVVPSSTTDLQLASTNTIAATASLSLAVGGAPRISADPAVLGRDVETAFRLREKRDLGGAAFASRANTARRVKSGFAHTQLTGVPSSPTVGSVFQLNSNLDGNTCTDPKVLHGARVVSVLPHTIVLIDTQSPTGGYSDAELTAFGMAFDTLGFALDTTNFGANTDIDNNGRIAIFFTPGINKLPGPVGSVVGGLFAARDLFPANSTTGCIASNEGEMFYMPVPDPNSTINGNYKNKTFVSSLVVPTLVHEFQHLINAGRRIYVNGASDFEEVWLNEGLSHIAEELLYYRQSGNAPLQNIDATRVRSSQPQVDAFNNDQSENFARLSSYLQAPESNSPYSLVDGLEMRGAIWQLLRYSADQKGGSQRATWLALVNSVTNGQANFNAVFGSITTNTRNWAVAQFVDDIGLSVPAQYTNPSWNYRSVFSALGGFPLATHSLVTGTNVQLTLVGGGAGYVRFGVAPGVAATVAATSTNQLVPPNIDFIVVRTK